MHDHDRKYVEDFFKAIEPNLPGYQQINFSYVACKNGKDFEILQAKLQLQGVPTAAKTAAFQSENIKAGICSLSELNLTPRSFVDALLSGKLQTPNGELLFKEETDRQYSANYESHHRDGLASQRRQIHLSVSGGRRPRIDSVSIDWELKAAPTPFFNFQELLDEFFVGALRGDSVNVEIIGYNVAAVSPLSTIDGTKAKLMIELAEGLERKTASIGYRIFEKNRIVKRGELIGSELNWESVNNLQRGKGEVDVPIGAVIDCTARYAGIAQSHFWAADPKTAQNPFRAVHHAFDNNLGVLRELIAKAQTKGANARDLEIAVAWLLWMLGFSTTHIGGTPKTSDAPDLIAATPFGHLIVVECTTGILKEGSKLPHLFERAEKVRQSLVACGNQHLKVLPVIVTTKTRDEVKSELDQAHKNGALVATIEDFSQLIDRTLLFPSAERLFTEAEETLQRLQNPSPFNLTMPGST